MKRAKALLLLAALALAAACGRGNEAELLVLVVRPQTFEITIPAFGELQSAQSTPLATPAQLRGRQTIAWIAADNSRVRRGEVVVRLNSLYYAEQVKIEEANVAKIDLEIAQKERQMRKEKSDVQGQVDVTAIERELADTFAARDETIYSRNKIIEDGIDLELLEKKERHYRKQGGKLERKTRAELLLLLSRRRAVQTKLDQHRAALKSLEIQAPHDGLFVIDKTWSGEKFRVGMDIWGGQKLGTLPDLSRMEAKLFVLESEASGLKEKLPVTLALDLEPGRTFSGRVAGIDTIAKPLDEKSPLKYFQARVALDATEPELMKPGAQVKAMIMIDRRQGVLCVPNQALLFEGEKAYVHVRKGGRAKRRLVETGERSLTRTVIRRGLAAGESVLLGVPQPGE